MTLTQRELARRLAQARERARKSQQEVADALGLSRSAISQMESAARQVSSLELLRLAELYGLEVRDLLEGRDPHREFSALYRAQGVVDRGVERAIEESLPLFRAVGDLEDVIEQQEGGGPKLTLSWPLPAGPAKADSEGRELAGQMREQLGLGAEPITNLPALIFSQGIAVAEHALPAGVSGIFFTIRPGRALILVSEDEASARGRFSLAHEFCHALVDRNEKLLISREADASLRERRANSFAGAFLMPIEGVLNFTTEAGITPGELNFTHVAQLAQHFGLSYDATIVQLDKAHLLSPTQRQEFRAAERNARGYSYHKLGVRDIRFDRTTLREWGYGRMLHAFRRSYISRRKALSIAEHLGYRREVAAETLEALSEAVREGA